MKMNKITLGIVKVVPFIIGASTYFVSDWYWDNTCGLKGCDIYLIDAYLSPLRVAGILLTIVSAPFVFLPFHYFKNWTLYILFPAVLITLYSMSITDPYSSHIMSSTREQNMENFMYWWIPATLLFMGYHWYFLRKETPLLDREKLFGKFTHKLIAAILILVISVIVGGLHEFGIV